MSNVTKIRSLSWFTVTHTCTKFTLCQFSISCFAVFDTTSQPDRQTDRQTDREADCSQADTHRDRQTYIHTDRQQTDTQINRPTDR